MRVREFIIFCLVTLIIGFIVNSPLCYAILAVIITVVTFCSTVEKVRQTRKGVGENDRKSDPF